MDVQHTKTWISASSFAKPRISDCQKPFAKSEAHPPYLQKGGVGGPQFHLSRLPHKKGKWNHKWNSRGHPPSPLPFLRGYPQKRDASKRVRRRVLRRSQQPRREGPQCLAHEPQELLRERIDIDGSPDPFPGKKREMGAGAEGVGGGGRWGRKRKSVGSPPKKRVLLSQSDVPAKIYTQHQGTPAAKFAQIAKHVFFFGGGAFQWLRQRHGSDIGSLIK